MPSSPTLVRAAVACVAALAAAPSAQAQWQAELGPAPRLAAPVASLPGPLPPAPNAIAFDPANRAQVAQAYRNLYLPQGAVAMGWNGSVAG